MPTLSAPPAFRERVFAAIRAEERQVAPAIARLSRQATNPELPAVRSASGARRARRIAMAPRFALAAAAAIAITLLMTRVAPLLGGGAFGQQAASVGNGNDQRNTAPQNTTPHIAQYPVAARYIAATSALASSTWLVYSALDAAGQQMVFAESRRDQRAYPLLAMPVADQVSIRALTNSWAIWLTGAGASSAHWTLNARSLAAPDDTQTAPLTLLDSASTSGDTLTTLGGVWASGDGVLIAGANASGDGVLLRVDLASGTPVTSVLSQTSATGHLLTDPSAENGSYYWADVSFDSAAGLQSAIWQRDSAGHTSEVVPDQTAFHPSAASGTLAWVDVSSTALAGMATTMTGVTPDVEAQTLRQLNGSLEAMTLSNGHQWQVAPRADVTSVDAAGPLLVWASDAHTHAYDLRHSAAAAIERQIASAAFADTTATAVVWAQSDGDTLYVYDVR
ncbi:MAG: hypothetical protein OJF49_002386 [Ktedonobacterales bacterium]|nr:MAG: hypothetical protein OJF49_002386 [Ktedonobacterales bacterium]